MQSKKHKKYLLYLNSIKLYYASKSKSLYALLFNFTSFLIFLAILFTLFELFIKGVDISNIKFNDHVELLASMPVGLAVASTTLNPYYVTGFADGESCFYLSISSNSRLRTGYRVKVSFQIGLHENDLSLLKRINAFFGVGSITRHGSESVQYRVSTITDLKVIISHFDKYPLLTNKAADFKLFKSSVELVEQGAHLTDSGLSQLLSLKATLNTGLSESLKAAWPNIVAVTRPCVDNTTISNLFWLAGFTDALPQRGKGCF